MSTKKQAEEPEEIDELGQQPKETVDESDQVAEASVQADDDLAAELDALRQRCEETESKYRRALADYQNLERVTAEAQRRFAKLATQGFVEDLIQPYDNLLLAAKHIKDKGIDMIIAQFRQVFESQGLVELNPVGQPFDPSSMEAIETKEGEEGTVLEVAQVGYELNGIIVRPAKVVVGKEIQ